MEPKYMIERIPNNGKPTKVSTAKPKHPKKPKIHREQFACQMDVRVIKLIKENYKGKGKSIAGNLERVICADLGVTLPPPKPN